MTAPGTLLAQMRQTAPLVQNITNFVAMNIMANVMLAAGASPAMVHGHEEAAEFAGLADALSVNIGTASGDWVDAMEGAARAARGHGKPWVLDPVAAGATGFRRQLCARLMQQSPTILRGNASEILAVAGEAASGRGADTSDPVAAAEDAALRIAREHGMVVAVTGPVDYVTDGRRIARVANGDAMMPRVTALGCSLTGLVAAFAVGQDPFDATVAALVCFGVAGEVAAETARGPGSFQVAFLDALHALQPDQLAARARVRAS
ncbi:hydroxyethylthiazole kinase [Paracoccus sp. (in: a-proteobacteria)]|uniref:hydroxyethylthiazole kinase n=1 Tax=Paracoccus sp. TaxID=267 RepID=UPI003A8A0511